MQKCVNKKVKIVFTTSGITTVFSMDGSVLPGNKTLTCTLVVSIRPPHPGTESRIFLM